MKKVAKIGSVKKISDLKNEDFDLVVPAFLATYKYRMIPVHERTNNFTIIRYENGTETGRGTAEAMQAEIDKRINNGSVDPKDIKII